MASRINFSLDAPVLIGYVGGMAMKLASKNATSMPCLSANCRND
jgi:hypothetical protein